MKIVFMRFYTRHNGQGCIETACIFKFHSDDYCTGRTFTGNANQHPADHHVGYIGKKVAFARTLEMIRTKDQRRGLWQYFHKHFPNPSGGINV